MLAYFLLIILTFIPIILAITLHEIAHGFVALKCGDNTAQKYGRLSLNPLKHIDLFGTLVLPTLLYISNLGFIFGWAKPVPVDFSKIKTKKAFIFVAAAGVIINLLLALLSSFCLWLITSISSPFIHGILEVFFVNMVVYNIILAIFNLLPLPPLDGSKIFFGWLNKTWAQNYINADRTGLIVFIFLAFVLPLIGQILHQNWNILGWYIFTFSKFLLSFLL